MDAVSLPELPAGLASLDGPPLSLQRQRGRVVAVVFINAASAWCAQLVETLESWRARHAGRLALVVVCVPRFDRERDGAYVLHQLRRQGVTAPLLHDVDWAAWQAFDIEAWPSVCLLDATGRLHGRWVGLGSIPVLEREVSALCEALPAPEDAGGYQAPIRREGLRYPVGVAATDERLYIADSGRHRVLECTHQGRVLRCFGLGMGGFVDGPAGQAAFLRPHGLALSRNTLYVADTGNHAVRRIHLHSGDVDTLLGSGRPGLPLDGPVTVPRAVSLDRPMALAVAGGALYVATAGDNRLWRYELPTHVLHLEAGTGLLELHDGPGTMAAFAQPVALAAAPQALFVCDALGSAVRNLPLQGGRVSTVIGQGAWSFGQADGPRAEASLQHPQAIALSPNAPLLWIADSGNGQLRRLRLGGGELTTVALPRPLEGPAGLAVAAGRVWIAETDAHRVLSFDPDSGILEEREIAA